MAFLLLLHEKMRLQRKVSKLTLQDAMLSNRNERVTKNIERIQKMYAKEQTQLEKSAQLMMTQASVNIRNAAGLGTDNQMFNPYSGYNGITSFVANQMQEILSNGGKPIQDGIDFNADNGALYNNMMNELAAGTLKAVRDENDSSKILHYGEGKYTKEQFEAFMQAMRTAQSMQTQANYACQQTSSNFQNNVSIWLEAKQEELELEQQDALLPLEMEQTEIELEMNSCDAQLTYARQRLDTIKQACSEGMKDSAPTFGLG